MAYNTYPAVDGVTYQFPPEIITALAKNPELRSTIIPMTQTQRNDLSGLNLWDGRLVFNLTTKKINRYEVATLAWYEIDSDNVVLRAGDTMTGPLTLSGAPTVNLHAATKKYVDDYRPLSGRNRIINGDFSVNQRNFTSATTNVYGFDRWAPTLLGGTVTYSSQAATLGDLPESARTFARLAVSGQTAVDHNAGLYQRIENVRRLSGKTVTVSFWAKALTGTPKVAIEFGQRFGTGGSADVSAYIGQVTLSTSWVRYSVTGFVPSVAGKTIGTDDNLTFLLWVSAGTNLASRTGSLGLQSNTFDFWGVQVEEGPVASLYEELSYADVLRACQRYYVRLGGNTGTTSAYRRFGFGPVFGTSNAYIAVPLPVPMRVEVGAPSASSGAFSVYDASVNQPVTGWVVDNPSDTMPSLNVTVNAATLTLGRFAQLTGNASVGAWIAFNAEFA